MNHAATRTLFCATIMAVIIALMAPGCLLVRVTEHRIKVNESGGGEAMMRLTDIRSDGATDSARIRDFGIMIASVEYEGAKDFERRGRKVTAKKFMVNGDTLSAEISYTFPSLESIEGLKASEDGISVVIPEGREIMRTNGKIQAGIKNSQRIVWPKDARRLSYVIREHEGRVGTSLAPYYVKYVQQNSGTGK